MIQTTSIDACLAPPPAASGNAHAFITRWHGATASELATAQSFVADLC